MKRIVTSSETPRIQTLMRNNLPLQLEHGLQPYRAPTVNPSHRPKTTLYNGPQISIDSSRRKNFGSRMSNKYGYGTQTINGSGFEDHQINCILSDA